MSVPARIDGHQHFWHPDRGDYPWMPAEGPLVRPFLPDELRAERLACGIAGSIAVQAAPTVAETHWLCDVASQSDSGVVAVVGWADLESPDIEGQLADIEHELLVGVRPMIQDIPDDEWILRPSVGRGLHALHRRGLVFELLGYTRHLAPAVRALEQVPDLPVVIDHLMKPDYGRVDPAWHAGIAQLAARPNCFLKISGMATEVDAPPTAELFRRHVDVALATFGPARCLLGTDWPVSTLRLPYRAMVDLLDELVADLAEHERDALWRTNWRAGYPDRS